MQSLSGDKKAATRVAGCGPIQIALGILSGQVALQASTAVGPDSAVIAGASTKAAAVAHN